GLTYKGNMNNNYSVVARVAPIEAVTQPMGIQIGTMFTVQWQPSTAQWELLGASGKVLQHKKLYHFTLTNTDPENTDILTSLMRPELLRRGANISSNKPGLKRAADGVYDAAYQRYYALQANGNETIVSGIGDQWLL